MTVGPITLQQAVDMFVGFAESRVTAEWSKDTTRGRDSIAGKTYADALRDIAEAAVLRTPALKEGLMNAGFLGAPKVHLEVKGAKTRRVDPNVDLAIFEFAHEKVEGFFDSELFERLKTKNLQFKISTIRTKLSRCSTGEPNVRFLDRRGGNRSGSYLLTESGRKHYRKLKVRHSSD